MEVVNIIILILTCCASYLLGGVSIARLITKRKQGGIENTGSGNPGTMNMLRSHGLVMGLFTLFCDALKGVIPSLFGLLYFGQIDEQLGYVTLFLFGFCAVIGHIFPLFYKFKGGKGIATTFGVFMVADPLTSLILFGILVVILIFTKIGSLVSLLFITIDAIMQLFRLSSKGNWVMILIMWGMVLLDIYAHKQNIVRLVDNKENRVDLQDSLEKDINKMKTRKTKNTTKSDKVDEKVAVEETEKNSKSKDKKASEVANK
ncbi:MAG: glycerol-3-phosphate acyltransferase [Clostridiales bacterium]|nr:glycerol-3-phosphate acyltransferase [Clostridiales bacterium]